MLCRPSNIRQQSFHTNLNSTELPADKSAFAEIPEFFTQYQRPRGARSSANLDIENQAVWRNESTADRNLTTEEVLLDKKLADALALCKFYLDPEKKILGLFAVIVFLSLWEFMSGAWSVDNPNRGLRIKPMLKPTLMSAPSLIGEAAFDLFSSGEIYHDLYVSGSEFFGGFFLSVAVAIPFGIGMGWYKKDVPCLRSFR